MVKIFQVRTTVLALLLVCSIVSLLVNCPLVLNTEYYATKAKIPDKYVCTFFYPWYGGAPSYRHWSEGNHHPPYTWSSWYLPDLKPGVFDPKTELYDSSDEKVILWQLKLMKRARIWVAIISWWGIGTYEDQVFKKIMKIMESPLCPYRNLKWCIYYEKEGYEDPSVEEICNDLKYVIENYASSPYYFKINGRPVVFVYAGPGDEGDYALRWAKVREKLGIYTVLKVFENYGRYASCADCWHQYAPALRYEEQGKYSAFASPGFWGWSESKPRLVRSLSEFEDAVRRLAESDCKFLMIQTWNEYHEGTQIEPAQPVDRSKVPFTPAGPSYEYSFIDVVARYLGRFAPRPLDIELVMPINGSILGNPNVKIEVRARSPYSSKVRAFASIDGGEFIEMKATGVDEEGFTHFIISKKLDDGNHRVVIYAMDDLEFFSENLVVEFTVKSGAPEIRIKSPKQGAILRDAVDVQVEVSDAYLEKVVLSIDDVAVCTWSTPGLKTVTWNTAEWADGSHVIKVFARDKLGNTAESSIEVLVDNSKPSILDVEILPREPAEGEKVEVLVKARDEVSGVSKVLLWYRVNEGKWNLVAMKSRNNTWAGSIPSFSAGSVVEYYVEVLDNAGNSAKSTTYRYTVRAVTPPKVEILHPSPGSVIKESRVLVKWRIEKGTHRVVRVEIRLDRGFWIDVTGRDSYEFSNLSGGEHVVVVRAIDEKWKISEASVEFTVEAPRPLIPTDYLVFAAIAALILAVILIVKKFCSK